MHVKLNCGGEREAKDPHKAPAAAKKAGYRAQGSLANRARTSVGENFPKRAVASLAAAIAGVSTRDGGRPTALFRTSVRVLLELALKCRGDDRRECPILDELRSGASSVSNPIAS